MSGAVTPHRHHQPMTGLRVDAEVAAIKGLLAVMRSFPVDRVRRWVGAVTAAGPALMPRLRRVGLDNLQSAFPERDRAWCEQTLGGAFRQLGYLAGELAHFHELTPENIRDIVGFDSPETEAGFLERARHGGAIIATGHFGNWELFGQAAGLMGVPIHIVHRPLKNAKVDDLLTGIRGLAGTKVVYKHAAARDILRLLRRGALVAVPIDQHAPGGSGVPVPFFGRPANTTLGPARLAQIAQVQIQVAVLARLGDTNRHHIVTRPAIDPPPRGKNLAALLEVTTRLNEQFESIVREYPDQWLWMHRRWRVPA